MRSERVLFRATVLFSALSIVVFGGMAAYSSAEEDSSRLASAKSGKLWAELAVPCQSWLERNDGSAPPVHCENRDYIDSLKQSSDSLSHSAAEHGKRSRLFALMAAATPVFLFFALYAIRWVVTGVVRSSRSSVPQR